MDNNNIKIEAERLAKSAESFLTVLANSMDKIKEEFMKNPEAAKAYAEEMKSANVEEKIKEFKNTLNNL